MRNLVLLFLLGFALIAEAAAQALPVSTNSTGGTLTLGLVEQVGRAGTSANAGVVNAVRGVTLTSGGTIPVGTATAAANASRFVTAVDIGKAAARGVGITPMGVAVTVAGAAAWCRIQTGSWLCDDRQAQTLQNVIRVDVSTGVNGYVVNNGNGFGVTSAASRQALADIFNSRLVAANKQCVGSTCGRYTADAVGLYIASCFNGVLTCASPSYTTIPTVSAQVTQCPAITDPFNPSYSTAGGLPGVDGKCPTGRYSALSEQAFGDLFGREVPLNNLWPALQELALPAASPALAPIVAPLSLTGPASINNGSPTTTTVAVPGQAAQVTVNQPVYNITYVGDSYTVVPGTVQTAANGTTTTVSGPQAAPTELYTCGLPGKPACKIDESGTPNGVGVLEAAKAAVQNSYGGGTGGGGIGAPASTVHAVPWSFGYQMPQGACQPITASFAGAKVLTVDPCNSSGVALFRQLMGYLLASLTALELWQAANRAVQAS